MRPILYDLATSYIPTKSAIFRKLGLPKCWSSNARMYSVLDRGSFCAMHQNQLDPVTSPRLGVHDVNALACISSDFKPEQDAFGQDLQRPNRLLLL